MIQRGSIIDDTISPSIHELKAHLNLIGHIHDSPLELYLKAALRRAGAHIGRTIAQTNFTYTGAYAKSIRLPEALSITAVQVDGVTVESSSYALAGEQLTFADGFAGGTALTVTFIAGMAYIDETVKAAVLLIASDLFLHRENPVKTLPSQAEWLLDPYRRWGLSDGE